MNPEQLPLRDLHLPEAIGWWPPAPGWWVLFGLLATALLYAALLARRRWRYNRPRRLALRELARVERAHADRPDPVRLGICLSELLRRAALAYTPRNPVAGMTGRQWLEWLDRGLEGRPFTEGPARWLGELPYRRSGTDRLDVDAKALIEAVRQRLRTPFPETP
jgi:hypothetical protein